VRDQRGGKARFGGLLSLVEACAIYEGHPPCDCQLAHTLKLSYPLSQKKGHGFGPSAVDGSCGEEIEGTPHGKTLTGKRVPQQRAMSIMGGIQAGPGKTRPYEC
jgi:hypothetical protein